jgi:DNA-binding transcriptional ArsR family regulator
MSKNSKGKQRMAATFRALGHPTRLNVLEKLQSGPASPVDYTKVTESQESLGTVSHHFRALRQAGLIEVASTEQRRGALKHSYRLTREGEQVSSWVKRL